MPGAPEFKLHRCSAEQVVLDRQAGEEDGLKHDSNCASLSGWLKSWPGIGRSRRVLAAFFSAFGLSGSVSKRRASARVSSCESRAPRDTFDGARKRHFSTALLFGGHFGFFLFHNISIN